jgi:hypothetical protein
MFDRRLDFASCARDEEAFRTDSGLAKYQAAPLNCV